MEQFEPGTDEMSLARCVAAMATGDRAFVVTFAERFAGVVRTLAAERGVDVGAGDVGDRLVTDVALEVFDRAPQWTGSALALVKTVVDDVVSGPEGPADPPAGACGADTASHGDTDPDPQGHTASHGDADGDLTTIMAALAEGDVAFVTTLADHHGARIAAAVRRTLCEIGQSRLARDRHEIDEIVADVCLDVIFDKAGSWRADGGALPWVWAHRAIRQLIVARVGHARADLDVDALDRVASTYPDVSRPGATGDTWEDACALDERMPLLTAALDTVASARDRRVYVEYVLQKSGGDRSPANTVATMFGLTPANVRKIHQRVREKLTVAVENEARFTALRGLAILMR